MTQLLLLSLAACSGGGEGEAPDADADRVADSLDCAPQNSQVWRMLDFASRDDDADGFRANGAGQVCAGASLPANRFAASVSSNEVDCDDSDAAKWSTLQYAAVDADHDGFGAPGSGSACSGGALPAGLLATVPTAESVDCDDADAAKQRLLPFASRDQDGDAYRVNESGAWCGGDELPDHLSALASPAFLVDCNDLDASRWRWMATYRDGDGDGVGSGPATRACIGHASAVGYVLTGYDALDDPDDPAADATSTAGPRIAVLTPPDDGDDEDIFDQETP